MKLNELKTRDYNWREEKAAPEYPCSVIFRSTGILFTREDDQKDVITRLQQEILIIQTIQQLLL